MNDTSVRSSTTDSLDRTVDQRIDEIQFGDMLQQQTSIIKSETRELFKKHFTLVEKLFTKRQLHALVRDAHLNEIKSEVDFRLRLHELASDFTLQALSEKYNGWLKAIKVGYREQIIDFVLLREEELRQKVHARRYRFLEDTRKNYENLERYKDLRSVARRYEQAIEREQDDYYEWLRELVDYFKNIINEHIKGATVKQS